MLLQVNQNALEVRKRKNLKSSKFYVYSTDDNFGRAEPSNCVDTDKIPSFLKR